MRYTKHLLRHTRAALGQNVQELRTERQLSLEGLAERSGLPLMQIYQLEQGKKMMEIAVLVRIACALGVKPSRLLE